MFKPPHIKELEKLLFAKDEGVRLAAAAKLADLAESRRRRNDKRRAERPTPDPLAPILALEAAQHEAAKLQRTPAAAPPAPAAAQPVLSAAQVLAARWGVTVVEAPPPNTAACSEPGCDNCARIPAEWIEGRRFCHVHTEARRREAGSYSRTVEGAHVLPDPIPTYDPAQQPYDAYNPAPVSILPGELAGVYTQADGWSTAEPSGELRSERERLIERIKENEWQAKAGKIYGR